MPTKPTIGITSVGSQKDRRYPDTFFDQHRWTGSGRQFPNGRPWWGHRELAANREAFPNLKDGFCGGDLLPGDHNQPFESGWTAPWTPEFRFFEFDYLRNRITINYGRAITYDRQELDTYYRAAARISSENGWKETEYGAVPRYQIRALIGDAPRSPKIAQAAQAGDPWLLGFREEVNTELAPLLGLSTQGFAQAREVIEPAAKAGDVISMSKADLLELIQREAERILAVQQASKKRKGGSPEHMERMRAAKQHPAGHSAA